MLRSFTENVATESKAYRALTHLYLALRFILEGGECRMSITTVSKLGRGLRVDSCNKACKAAIFTGATAWCLKRLKP